jgi:hypothetical protein
MYKTKKNKKNIFLNKTRRNYRGGYVNTNNIQNINNIPNNNIPNNNIPNNNIQNNNFNKVNNYNDIVPKEGIIDLAGNTLKDVVKDTGDFVLEKGLRLIGLQPVNEENELQKNNMVSNAFNKANNIVTGAIQNINNGLKSPEVAQTVTDAARETSQIAQGLMRNFNENFNNPEFNEELKNFSQYATIGIKSIDPVIDDSIDLLNKAVTKGISGVASGAVKVLGDAVGAVPFIGPIADIGKAVNDGSKAVGSVVNAGSEVIEAASVLVGKTSENFKKQIEQLKRIKEESNTIMNRTMNSINQFENPINMNTINNQMNNQINNRMNTMNDSINNRMNQSMNNRMNNKVGGTRKKTKKYNRFSRKIR